MEPTSTKYTFKKLMLVWVVGLQLLFGCGKKEISVVTPPSNCVAACKTNFLKLAKKGALLDPSLSAAENNPIYALKKKILQDIEPKKLNLLTSGINFFEPVYFFLSNLEGKTSLSCVMDLASDKHFENFLAGTFGAKPKQSGSGQNKPYQHIRLHNVVVAWNKKMCVVTESDSSQCLHRIEQLLGLYPSEVRNPGMDFLALDNSDISLWLMPAELPHDNFSLRLLGNFLPFIPKNHCVNISIHFVAGGYTVTIHGKTPGMNDNFLKFLAKQAEASSAGF